MQEGKIAFPSKQRDIPATRGAARVGFNSVKLPVFIKGVGTVERIVVALLLLKSCASPKKKVLCLRIGPPIVPPNWFWLKWPRGTPPALFKNVFASKWLLRTNSHTSPWKESVPLLMDALMTAPADVPNSAE